MPQEWAVFERIADTVIPATGTGDFLFLIRTNFNLKLTHFIVKRKIKIIVIYVCFTSVHLQHYQKSKQRNYGTNENTIIL